LGDRGRFVSVANPSAFGAALGGQQAASITEADDLALCALSMRAALACCTDEENAKVAKESGIVRAMLAAFFRHPDDPGLGRAFLMLIERLVKDYEVQDAVEDVAVGCRLLRGLTGTEDLY